MSAPKRVLVTGASRGIGRAIAEQLLSEGRAVGLVARDASLLDEIAARAPERATPIALDLIANPGAVAERFVRGEEYDGFVHAAGIAPHAALPQITQADFERAWRLHVLSPMLSAQALAAQLRARRAPGSMVFVSSTLGLRPAATMLVYSATKAAQISMMRTLALELAPDAIRVNAVAPGVIDTDMARELRLGVGESPPTDPAALRARVAQQLQELTLLHPLGRLGRPVEVADAVRYLLDAEWTTGTVLTVDGGLNAG